MSSKEEKKRLDQERIDKNKKNRDEFLSQSGLKFYDNEERDLTPREKKTGCLLGITIIALIMSMLIFVLLNGMIGVIAGFLFFISVLFISNRFLGL